MAYTLDSARWTAETIDLILPNGTFKVMDMDMGEGAGKGPVREVFSRQWNEQQAVWRIVCQWSDRVNIAYGLLGFSSGSVYQLPKAYFGVPSWSCKKIECAGVGIASPDIINGFISFPYAELTITFGVPEFNNSSMVSEMELDFSTNSIPVDQTKSTFEYSGGAKVPPNAIPAYRLTTVFGTISLFNRGSLNTGLYLGAVDNTNSATFQGAAAGKVMFRGASSDRMFTASGLLQYTVKLMFELNPRGWDAILKPGTGWTTYAFIGGGAPWTSSDLNLLLA